MPQEKFITRAKGNINYMDSDYTQTKKGMKANTGAYKKATGPAYDRFMKLAAEAQKDRAGSDPLALGRARKALDDANNTAFPKQYDAEIKATNRVVTARDATNARVARERLASRASKANPRGGGMMAKAAALGPVAEGAAALYAADEATGFRRTKYSGNSGGPSFSMNPYASSNKSSYAGQSAMSKAMGVGKKK